MSNAADPVESGQIQLEMDGEALCHIINLYQSYSSSYGCSWFSDDLGQDGDIKAQFPFGKLSVKPEDDGPTASNRFFAHFEPGTTGELSAPRHVFLIPDDVASELKPGRVPQFNPTTVVIQYLSALFTPSKANASMKLPRPDEKLPDRCRALCSAMNALDSAPWDQPFILTRPWVEQANRIMRRATTNGGADKSLATHLIAALSEQKLTAEILDYPESREYWHEIVDTKVNEKCMFDGESFTFHWHISSDSMTHEEAMCNEMIPKYLPSVLENFSKEPPGSWLHSLSQMVPEFKDVFSLALTRREQPVIVLALAQDHKLWQRSTCLIQC